ncbi:MAG TPA: hypothetical protein VJ951_02250, partial [Bacteroidales bacterium]|nr:hypothetical protein [Bacteroidales bacterium]
TSQSILDNIRINNTSSGILLNQDIITRNEVNFTDGIIKTQGFKFIMQNGSNVTSFSPDSYIYGTLRRHISTGTFDLPLGALDLAQPASIEFTDATGVLYIDATFIEDNSQTVPLGLTVSGSAITEFLNKGYWTITPDNAGTPSYDITIQSFGHTNGGASADQYAVISDIGSGWQDYGTHSSSTQVVSGDSVQAKRSELIAFGSYIIGQSEDDTYEQPLITNEIRNEGVYFKSGSAQVHILGSGAALNNDSTATTTIDDAGQLKVEGDITNNENSTIKIDGSIELTGDWVNNAIASLTNGDGTSYGTVTFNGTERQRIAGSSATLFENLILDNASDIVLNQDIQVNQGLTLTEGLLITQTNKSIFVQNASITGYDENKYIVGNMRQFVGTGTFNLPLGTEEYTEMASIEYTDATGVTYIDATFVEDHTQNAPIGLTVSGAAITEFLDQGYWTITPDDPGTSTYNISIQSFGHTNGGANADKYAVITDPGSGWDNLGTHSNSTQVVNGDSVLAKRSNLNLYGNYIIGKSEDDTYDQPLITDEFRNEGVHLKLGQDASINILGQDGNFNNDSTAITNIAQNAALICNGDVNNNENATISIDGTLELTGDWTNNSVASLTLNDATAYGTIMFNGTSLQRISGSSITEFENFTINNPSGVILAVDQKTQNTLNLTNGIITTTSHKIVLAGSATISGHNENSFIEGNLRRYVSTGNYPLPLGAGDYYELADINITDATGLTYIDATFTEDHTQVPPTGITVNGAAVTEFLNFGYWTVTPDNSGSSQFNITLQSIGHTNGGGTADQYSVITDRGSGWEDVGNHSPATQQINGDSIIAKRSVLSDYGSFIIGKTYEDTYVQPVITKELRNDGVYLKTAAGAQLNITGTNAGLYNDDAGTIKVANSSSIFVNGNLLNDNGATLTLNGELNLTGDWTNNATTSLSDGDITNYGTVTFIGTETQHINGSVTTQFENLTVNNTQNIVLDNDQEITQTLDFSSGLLETDSNRIIVSNATKDAISNYTENKYIYGNLRRYTFTGDTIFFPIGTDTYFEESYVLINSGTGLSYLDMSFTRDNTQTPPGGLTVSSAIINEFLNYGYWSLAANGGMTAIDYDLTCISSGHTNGVVTSDSLALISDIGSGWQDYGNHSPSAQNIDGIYTTAKRSNLTQMGSFIIGASNSPTYDQAPMTDELRVKEGILKVADNATITISGPFAALNSGGAGTVKITNLGTIAVNGDINLSGTGAIQNDGNLMLTKDWINKATSSVALGDATNKGTVTFNGTLAQTIDGTVSTYFENLEIDNSNGVSLLNSDPRVDEQLIFTNGMVNTGSQRMAVYNITGTGITGHDTEKYINGILRQYVATGTYELPVGTANEYELAEI